MITLYSGPLSLFTAKVRIALAEKNLDYKRIEVPFGRAEGYEPKHPEVVRHNPKQQVPVLVVEDGGTEPLVLWDSTVIVEYLDELQPSPPLFPADPAERARCRMLELHADEVFFANVWTLIQNVFYPGGDGASEVIAEAQSELARHYADLDKMLEGRDWIGGEDMTAADVSYRLATLFASTLKGAPSPELKSFGAWIARMDARPSVAAELGGLVNSIAAINA